MKRDLVFRLVMWILAVIFGGLGTLLIVVAVVLGGEIRLPFLLGGGCFAAIGVVGF